MPCLCQVNDRTCTPLPLLSCSLNEKYPHGLTHLNTEALATVTVWGGLGPLSGVDLLGEGRFKG